jgi:hypothetical protein
MTRNGWLAVMAMFVAQLSVCAEDMYSVKLRENATGDVVAVEASLTMTLDLKLEDANGKQLKASVDKSERTTVYTDTVLDQEAGKPANRLSRHYDKDEVQRGDKTNKLPHEGQTVIIERKDGKYSFQTDGQELTGADAAGLDKEFNQDPDEGRRDLVKWTLPGKPVAPNDSWMIDMAPVIKHLKQMTPFETDSDQAKGTGILRKVYTKGDRQYGVWHLDMEMPVKSFGEGARKLVLDDGAKITVGADVEACIDGSVEDETLKLDMKIEGSATPPSLDGGKGKLMISIHANGPITRKEQPKK